MILILSLLLSLEICPRGECLPCLPLVLALPRAVLSPTNAWCPVKYWDSFPEPPEERASPSGYPRLLLSQGH